MKLQLALRDTIGAWFAFALQLVMQGTRYLFGRFLPLANIIYGKNVQVCEAKQEGQSEQDGLLREKISELCATVTQMLAKQSAFEEQFKHEAESREALFLRTEKLKDNFMDLQKYAKRETKKLQVELAKLNNNLDSLTHFAMEDYICSQQNYRERRMRKEAFLDGISTHDLSSSSNSTVDSNEDAVEEDEGLSFRDWVTCASSLHRKTIMRN
ncbi:expressed unknown protein [Seminavis robusta]|uniref:Uncharacterized protein n=1 Tax=Seminavis robusta TaxID=568900 RepID=A0A9N8HIT4_9STRA|nr:expressed unknown protein [Seminavis robusta]|eukprot:Sro643_g180310.1 n/a (212) ;mRNA; f:28502-29137